MEAQTGSVTAGDTALQHTQGLATAGKVRVCRHQEEYNWQVLREDLRVTGGLSHEGRTRLLDSSHHQGLRG